MKSNPPLIFDIGTSQCKIGFARKDCSLIFPTVVGKAMNGEIILGSEAVVKPMKERIRPLDKGTINDMESIQAIFDYSFKQLGTTSDSQPVVLADSPYNSSKQRFQLVQMMFETFNVPSLYMDYQSAFSLYSSGQQSGVILEIGDGITQIIPIIAGCALKHGMFSRKLAGSDVTEYLQNILEYKDPTSNLQCKKYIRHIQKIKEENCYIAYDYQNEYDQLLKSKRKEIFAQGGEIVYLREQMIEAPELLFNPGLNSSQEEGIHEILNNQIKNASQKEEVRAILYDNIFLSGGTTSFKGFEERLLKELQTLEPHRTISIFSLPNPSQTVWRGASIINTLDSFQTLFVSQQEYREKGTKIINEKCFSCLG